MNIGILLFDSDQSMTLTELELIIKHTLYLPFGIVANQLPHVFTLQQLNRALDVINPKSKQLIESAVMVHRL